MSKITIGKNLEDGKDVSIDLPRLIETRLLIQANAGGGKSYLLRRLLEQSHGKVQQIILDMEGEFSTLREKYDYLLVAKNGDIPVSIKTAEILARKVLELNVSVIIDLYELKHHERILFVKRFLDTMINVPKELWHSCLVVLDEGHVFAPEKGNAESSGAVVDMASRGRKRGFCLCIATQRISKLSKDVCAELNNKLIGRASLDIDMKRASEELGFTSKEDMQGLRKLSAGEFYTFGPAVSDEVTKIKVGEIYTTHPKAGSRQLLKTTPPTKKIKMMLSKLVDLPKEAEDEMRTIDDFKKKIRELQMEIRSRPKEVKEKIIIKDLSIETRKSYETEIAQHRKALAESMKSVKSGNVAMQDLISKIKSQAETTLRIFNSVKITEFKEIEMPTSQKFKVDFKATVPIAEVPHKIISGREEEAKTIKSKSGSGAMRMLKAIAMFHPKPVTRQQIATLAGISSNSGTFGQYLSYLRVNQWIIENDTGRFEITEEGKDTAGDVDELPTDPLKIVDMWSNKFGGGAARMLKAIADRYPNEISKEELSSEIRVSYASGTFGQYLSQLRSNGLIKTNKNSIVATKELFMED